MKPWWVLGGGLAAAVAVGLTLALWPRGERTFPSAPVAASV